MLQLDHEQNIHAHSGTSEPETPPDFEPRYQQVTRSPLEEMAARIAEHGMMEPIPDSLAALMLQDKRREQVEPNGISFILNGKTHHYFHPSCQSCHPSRVGERVLLSYNRDDLSVIYLLTDDERYVETVPLAEGVEWFAPEMEKKIQEYRSTARHIHEGLKKTHAKTTKAEHDRTKANAEALQTTSAFALPKDCVSAEPEGSRQLPQRTERGTEPGFSLRQAGTARPRFERAEEVKAAQDAIIGQRAKHEERTGRRKRRGVELDAMVDNAIDEIYG